MVIWKPAPYVLCPDCNRVNFLTGGGGSDLPGKCFGCHRVQSYCQHDLLPIIPASEWKAGRRHTYSVYLLRNSRNDLIYVGRTKKGLHTRMGQYLDWCRANPRTVSRPIHHAIRDIGEDAFAMILLEEVNSDAEQDRERYWINRLDARNPLKGYNRA